MRWLVAAVGVLSLSVWLARRSANSPSSTPFLVPSGWQSYSSDSTSTEPSETPLWPSWNSESDQTTKPLEDLIVTFNPSTYTPANVSPDVAAANVRAFLDVIAWAEGADYNTLYGGGSFDSYADHPRQYLTFRIGGRDVTSSAAGRYQFLARTWDALRDKLGLQDFGPASQDAGAVELIRERGALRDVQAGRFAAAVEKVRKVWASLPGAGYAQPEKSLSQLSAVYARAGGSFEGQA